jgi:type III restriction enzyme
MAAGSGQQKTSLERRFAVLVDDDGTVIRWAKPGRHQFMIEYRRGERYEPDFVVETLTEKLICEVKARNEILAKARAARTWIGYANKHAKETAGKPWRYVLIPHDEIIGSATLVGLVAKFDRSEIRGLAA